MSAPDPVEAVPTPAVPSRAAPKFDADAPLFSFKQLVAAVCFIVSLVVAYYVNQAAVESKITGVSQSVASAQASIEARIAGVDTHVTKLDADLSGLKDRVSNAEQRLNAIAAKVEPKGSSAIWPAAFISAREQRCTQVCGAVKETDCHKACREALNGCGVTSKPDFADQAFRQCSGFISSDAQATRAAAQAAASAAGSDTPPEMMK